MLRALAAAKEEKVLVRLRRAGALDDVSGYVLAVGRRWVLLARVADTICSDGWTAVRLRSVRRVRADAHRDFVDAALRLRGQWPPRLPDQVLDLDSSRALLGSLRGEELVAVHPERRDPDICFVGVVRDVRDVRDHLVEVTPGARWEARRRRRRLRAITRVDVGGSYEAALRLVAGAAPPPELV